jgi:hypothetical protein
MSTTLSSTAVTPLSLYYGKDLPAQMSEVRTEYLRDLKTKVSGLLGTIELESQESIQRLKEDDENLYANSRTKTDVYVCRYENCGVGGMSEKSFQYGL